MIKKQAFEGLAKSYDRARPTYPHEMYNTIVQTWKENVSSETSKPLVVDVGCGTGISTRAFYNALEGNCNIIGVEPGRDMLASAIENSPTNILYKEGSAEAIPVDSESVDIVTAAQAAQWFNRNLFYCEVQRILKPNGVVAIYENNRDWENSDFLAKHEEFLEKYSVDTNTQEYYSRYYRNFPYENELVEKFKNKKTSTFLWNMKMSPTRFLEMAKTSTQVKRAIKATGVEEVDKLILKNACEHVGADEQVDVQYNTKLYIARK